MQSASRWLNWKPEQAKALELTTDRTDKTSSSVSSVSCQLGPFLMGKTAGQDPNLWQEDFSAWAKDSCTASNRCFSGVSSLYVHFCEWSLKNNLIACMRGTFEVLLEVNGFENYDGLVAGVVLKVDLKVLVAEYPVIEREADLR